MGKWTDLALIAPTQDQSEQHRTEHELGGQPPELHSVRYRSRGIETKTDPGTNNLSEYVGPDLNQPGLVVKAFNPKRWWLSSSVTARLKWAPLKRPSR